MLLRGYLLYALTFLALAAGLWAVLSIGAALQAPAEIAGQWSVRWETASPSGSGYHGTMKVDQSGRYCTFHFDGARTMSLKMVAGSALGQGDPQQPTARLVGDGYQVTLHPTATRGALRVEIWGRDHHRGFAERVSRPSQRAMESAAPMAARTAAPMAAPTVVPVADARR